MFAIQAALLAAAPVAAQAQDSGQTSLQNVEPTKLEEVVTIGTRVKGRTVTESSVPVDVLDPTELAKTPSVDLKDSLAAVSPSYYVDRNAAADQDTFARETYLRGLDGGQVLVLLNGKRVHRSAIVNKSGVQPANLSTFASGAVQRIEVLRDGASALYGADAVAGVINLVLDNQKEGLTVDTGYSKYYEGDGALVSSNMKFGTSLGQRGFLTVTGSYSDQDPTQRAKPHLGAIAMIADGQRRGVPVDVDPATIFPFGIADTRAANATWNAEVEVNDDTELYAFGNYSNIHSKQAFNFRENLNCVGSASAHPGLPLCSTIPELRFRDGSIGAPPAQMNPTKLTQAQLAALIGTEAAARSAYLLADGPNATSTNGAQAVGYDPKRAFPNGYVPYFVIEGEDVGAYVGARGRLDSGLTWDFSGSFGRSRIDYNNTNTQNPSLGAPRAADGSIDYANVQKDFYIGGLVNIERTVGLDFTYPLQVEAVDTLQLSFGTEYRSEQYYNIAGEENSWKIGPLVDLSVGANGFAGISPKSTFDVSRNNYAAYVDLDAQVNERLNLSAALRYEDFSDFGDNLSGKASARYELVEDVIAIRGAVSTGFHAPSLAQINTQQISSAFRAGEINYGGLFPAYHPLSQALGARELKPETATNLSLGFVMTPGDRTNLTLDLFQIELKDRIRLSQRFAATDVRYAPAFQQLLASGFAEAAFLTDARFFANGIDTTSRGVEVVGTQSVAIGASDLSLTLAYAYTETEIDRFDPRVSDARTNFNLEHLIVPHKATLTADYSFGDLSISPRLRWYGDRKVDQGFLNADGSNRIDENPGVVFLDLSARYRINDMLRLTIGADNVLNTYPKALPDLIESSNKRGAQYIQPGPDWQGGSYYLRLTADF